MARGRNNHPAGTIPTLEKRQEILTAKIRDGFHGAANGARQRMVVIEIHTEKIVDVIIRSIFGLRNLLKNDRSFPLNLLAVKNRMEKNVGQEIHRQRQILVQHFGVITGVLLRRKRVEHSSYRIHLLRDLGCGPSLRALEKQMLNKVGNPVLLGRFVAGAVLHPNTQAGGTMIRHLLRNNPDAVIENSLCKHRKTESS